MMGRFEQTAQCDNMNHRRRDAPVGHCPQCGGVVNQAFSTQRCSELDHATARRRQNIFCVNCGTRLVVTGVG